MNYVLVTTKKGATDITVRRNLNCDELLNILKKLGYSENEARDTVNDVKSNITSIGQSNTYGFLDMPTIHVYMSNQDLE